MSQLRHTSSPSTGGPDPFPKITWADFVQIVLELTVTAYRAMYKAKVARRDWEENVFTVQLGDNYLRPIAFDLESPVYVILRTKKHTDQMRKGEQPTIQAKEIDLMLFGSWEKEYHEKHFVWEAKRVGDKRVNRNYSHLNAEYVNEAMYRFIRREYADKLSDAGVLGYVLAGDIVNIVNDINASMGKIRTNPALPDSNHLHLGAPIHDFEPVYRSHHTRTDNTVINLHHLFLAFDFV